MLTLLRPPTLETETRKALSCVMRVLTPNIPMSTADHAGQVAHPDEIDTRPTRTPLHMEATSHCLPAPRHRSRMTAVIPPKEAEIVVVAKIRAAVAVAAPSMASVESPR